MLEFVKKYEIKLSQNIKSLDQEKRNYYKKYQEFKIVSGGIQIMLQKEVVEQKKILLEEK